MASSSETSCGFCHGLIALLADLLLWSSVGPGYLRRRTYVDQGPGYGGYPGWRYPRRRVIEEEEGPGGPGPGY